MRRQAREVAFQIIFQRLFTTQNNNNDELLSSLKKQEDIDFANQILLEHINNKQEIEKQISENLVGYELSRVYKVDLALLQTALTEIKYIHTPVQVVINETLEIAKKYSTEKSAKFINGVLSAIIKGEK